MPTSAMLALRDQLYAVRCKIAETSSAALALCDHQLVSSLTTMEHQDLQGFHGYYTVPEAPPAPTLRAEALPDDCMSCLVSQLYKELVALEQAAKTAGDTTLMLMAYKLRQQHLQNNIDEIAATGEEFEMRDCSKPGVTRRVLGALSQLAFPTASARTA